MYSKGYTSKLLEEAVDQFASLPGVGRKSALRMALHTLKQPKENVEKFASSFLALKSGIKYCSNCYMLSDTPVCPICSNRMRNHSIICVVESVRDVMSIENTEQYSGLYHVLGGIISPMEGIGPDDLTINELIERVKAGGIEEVVLALSTGIEGETTSFYIFRKLEGTGVRISTIARGVGFGDDLEYADELTLGRAIENRQAFKI